MTGIRAWIVITTAALVTIICSPCAAHDLGAMRVTCTFRADQTYHVEVLVDREHLPSSMAIILPTSFAIEFVNNAVFSFDGNVSSLVAQGPDTQEPTKFIIQFTGTIPPNAVNFTFTSRLTLGEYFLRLQHEGDTDPLGYWLNDGLTSPPFSLKSDTTAVSTGEIVWQYLILGFTHIVPKGLDHILFVLGLFLLSLKIKPILLQVTAFTVAHSITLALSIYGVVSLPSSIVEPLIALSITYVAVENLFVKEYKPWRTAIVFAFGLLHGLGFAGVLEELGLPRSQFVPALVSFNVGVELGQLSVITAAFLAVGLPFGAKQWYRKRITIPASVLISLVGLYWTIERIWG